jgi:hypothetical protein
VAIRGNGVKNSIVVDDRDKYHDFGSVAVGQSDTFSLRLLNISPRPIFMSLYDEPVVHGETVRSLESQNIFVHPKCFLMKEGEFFEVIVRYAPETSMTSFDMPLKFVCAGMYNIMYKYKTTDSRFVLPVL